MFMLIQLSSSSHKTTIYLSNVLQVVQWMCMADNEILPAACTWVFPTMGIMQFNKNATERAKEDIKAALKTLNDHLLTRSSTRTNILCYTNCLPILGILLGMYFLPRELWIGKQEVVPIRAAALCDRAKEDKRQS